MKQDQRCEHGGTWHKTVTTDAGLVHVCEKCSTHWLVPYSTSDPGSSQVNENQTVDDMNNLRHMLGVGSHIHKRDWGYRNHFNAGPGHSDMPSLLRLEAAGLIRRGHTDYFHATEAGCKAIGLSARQIKKALTGE